MPNYAYANTTCTELNTTFGAYSTKINGCPNSANGIVRGSYWYFVDGSLQDWSYLETGCIDLTIELSMSKSPILESEIDRIFSLNISSILSYIKQASLLHSERLDIGTACMDVEETGTTVTLTPIVV